MKIKIRIVNKKRALMTCCILLLLIFSLFTNKICLNSASGKNIDNIIEHTVNKGDTLWSIAESYKCSNEDIRSFIYNIKKLNNIGAEEFIIPGQILIIPCD